MNRPDSWTLHNLIGHPASEVMYLLGFKNFNWVHDKTLPEHEKGTGRG